MSISADSAKAIALMGVDMIITAESALSGDSVKSIVQIVKSKGRHITVHAGSRSSDTLKSIALMGGDHVTIAI